MGITALLVTGAVAGGLVISPGGGGPNPCAGFTFCDEFNDGVIDTTKWTVMNDHSDQTNNELACYLTQNTVETGGFLTETVKRETHSCPGGTTPVNYTSGAIQTKTFNFGRGTTIDVRAKFAGGQGPWPAIWLLGANCQQPAWLVNGVDSPGCNWPNVGSEEIDLAEVFADIARDGVQENLINAGGTTHRSTIVSDLSTAFHVYSLVWTASSLVFKVDGTTVNTMNVTTPNTPMFLIIDTTIGGSSGLPITDATLPQTTSIDYVHIT